MLTFQKYVFYINAPLLGLVVYRFLQGLRDPISELKDILKSMLSNDRPHGRIWSLCNELPHLVLIGAQFIGHFEWVQGSGEDNSIDHQWHIVLCDDRYGSQIYHWGFHTHLEDVLRDRVDNVETRLQDLLKPAKWLQHSQFGCLELY